MTKAELLKRIEAMPDDAPIFLDGEGGVDFARSVTLVSAKKTLRDWRYAPVCHYRIYSEDAEEYEATTGAQFDVILISLDQQP